MIVLMELKHHSKMSSSEIEGTKEANEQLAQLNESEKESVVSALSSLEPLMILNKDVLDKLEKIDKELVYRRFYFPGGTPKLYMKGDQADTNEIHYVQDNTDGGFDPRFIKDYIAEAKQYGFHRHVIVYNPSSSKYEAKSFDQLKSLLQTYYINDKTVDYIRNSRGITTFEKQVKQESMAALFASLIYFDKYKLFMDEFKREFKAEQMEKVMAYYDDYIQNEIYRLTNAIGQTHEDFVKNDYGWMGPESLAFDASIFIADYAKYKAEYDKLKDQIWQWLSQITSLNLCANRVSGIYQASDEAQINLTQMSNCYQSVKTAMENETDDGKTNENDKPAQNSAEPTSDNGTSTPEDKPTPEAKPTTNVQPASTSTSSDISKPSEPIDKDKPSDKETNEVETADETNDEAETIDASSKWKKMAPKIAIIIVVAILLLGLMVTIAIKTSSNKQSEDITSSDKSGDIASSDKSEDIASDDNAEGNLGQA